jgi:hypothetical protein
MDQILGGKVEAEQAETAADSVVQALGSDDPEIRASAFNATLGLLFRLHGLTQNRQTQEQADREVALIQLPVAEALRSEDAWTRSRAGGALNGLLNTLQEVTRKKQRVEQMIEQLREEINLARRARQRRMFRAFLLLTGALGVFFVQGSHIFMFWWMVFPLSGFWAVDRSRGHAAVQRLSEAWDPRAVGVLAIVAQERDTSLSDQAQQALVALLPRVRASDAAYIDAEGMTALIELLKEDYDALRLALLTALEQIGDERAITRVMEVRDSPRISLEVRQAAAECLPTLKNRVRLARESSTLLRASSGLNPAEAAAVLLRPASGAPASTDNLLRAVDHEAAPPSIQTPTVDPARYFVQIPSESVSDDTTLQHGTSIS